MFMLASGVLLAVAYSALSPLWKPAATPAGPTPPAAEPPAHAGRQRASAQLPRVTVTVLFREESRTMEFQRPVTAEAIVQGLFPQERAAGYRVRIISGGGAREGAEVLLPQEDDTLTVHAVVSGGVGAPPSPAPAPATAQGGGWVAALSWAAPGSCDGNLSGLCVGAVACEPKPGRPPLPRHAGSPDTGLGRLAADMNALPLTPLALLPTRGRAAMLTQWS